MAAAIGFEFAVVAIAKQSVVVEIGFEIDAAAIAPVTAGGTATWNIFFAAKGHAAIAAVAGLHEDFGFINKHGNKTPEKDTISKLPKPEMPERRPRLLKRLVLILLILVCVAAAALYVLYFRRTPLPAAAPHARVVPAISTIPGIAACWVETGKTFSSFSFGSTAGSVLVRHPAGDLLIDTGNSSHFDDEIRGFPFGTWLQLKSLAGELKPESPLPQRLRQIGEDPAKLRWAILSHVHLDHSGGLMDLPPLPVLLTREELQFANDPSVQAKGFVTAAHVQKFPLAAAPTLKFNPEPL